MPALARKGSTRRSFRPTVELLDERELPAIMNLSPVGPLAAVSGTTFTGTLATFQDTNITSQNAASTLAHLHATINWGDGHTSAGTVGGPDVTGNLTVTGSYLFPSVKTYPVTVTVQDDLDQSSASTLTLVFMNGITSPQDFFRGPAGTGSDSASSTLSVSPVPVNATADQLFTGVVGTITDSSANPSASNLVAVVDWGDGTRIDLLPVQATANPGVFSVVGSHLYVVPGSGTLQLWVESLSDNRTAVTAGSVTVTANFQSSPTTPTSTFTPATGPHHSSHGKPQGVRTTLPGELQNPFGFFVLRHGHRIFHSVPHLRTWFSYFFFRM